MDSWGELQQKKRGDLYLSVLVSLLQTCDQNVQTFQFDLMPEKYNRKNQSGRLCVFRPGLLRLFGGFSSEDSDYGEHVTCVEVGGGRSEAGGGDGGQAPFGIVWRP